MTWQVNLRMNPWVNQFKELLNVSLYEQAIKWSERERDRTESLISVSHRRECLSWLIFFAFLAFHFQFWISVKSSVDGFSGKGTYDPSENQLRKMIHQATQTKAKPKISRYKISLITASLDWQTPGILPSRQSTEPVQAYSMHLDNITYILEKKNYQVTFSAA